MISLIICSTRPHVDDKLLSNISQTIGTEYEVIHIDNSKRQYNIFEAYNLGVERAKGDFLCFMHEDIAYHSKNWGKAVEHHLSQKFIGAIGVAGGSVVLDRLDWRFYGFGQVYLIQGNSTIEEHPEYYYSHKQEELKHPMTQVAILDGVWICMRKELFNQIRFDDKNFHDFHLYDSDICMQVNKLGFGVFVTYDVLLEHKSEGTFSEGYKEGLKVFSQKWKDDLPMVKGFIVTQEEIDEALEKAQVHFDKRLAHDMKVIELRKVLNMKRQGLPTRDYTEDEKKMMDGSAFLHRRLCIKDREIPSSEVRRLIKSYHDMPFTRHTLKLCAKYFWYRILKL